MTNRKGVLYVVATPIGNLQDISERAIATLKGVSRIAAEDTRHSARLLSHFGINTPMVALHEHNVITSYSIHYTKLYEGQTPQPCPDGAGAIRQLRGGRRF